MKVDAFRAIAQTIDLEAGKISSKVNVGDVLHVQVVSASDKEVVLRLADGKTISASTLTPLNISAGDSVDFLINDKRDGKIFLETLKDNGTAPRGIETEQIKNILTSIKIPNNQRNIDIVNELIGREVPVNKENIQAVSNSLVKYPNLDVQKAVFMVANGVAIEEKSIGLLNQYAESKIALGNQIEALFKEIDNLNDQQALSKIFNNISSFENQIKARSEAAVASAGSNGSNMESAKPSAEDTKTNPALISNLEKEKPMQEVKQLAVDRVQNSFAQIQKEILPAIKQIILDKVKQDEAKIEATNRGKVQDLNFSEQKNIELKNINLNDIKFKNVELKDIIKNIRLDELEAVIEKFSSGDKALIEQLLKSKDFNKEGNNLADFKDNSTINLEHLKGKIKELFEKHFVSNQSDSLKEDLNVKESYKEILTKLDVIKDVLTKSEGSGQLLNLIRQTEDNIKFMNNLSQYNTFIQIPLNVWGHNTNGELYVLKNSKKKIDTNNANVFLSLQMPNMGLTEVLINVTGKSVTCNFRVEDDRIASLVRKHASELVNALNRQGYNIVNIDCGLIQKKTNLLDISKLSSQTGQAKRQPFDVRV